MPGHDNNFGNQNPHYNPNRTLPLPPPIQPSAPYMNTVHRPILDPSFSNPNPPSANILPPPRALPPPSSVGSMVHGRPPPLPPPHSTHIVGGPSIEGRFSTNTNISKTSRFAPSHNTPIPPPHSRPPPVTLPHTTPHHIHPPPIQPPSTYNNHHYGTQGHPPSHFLPPPSAPLPPPRQPDYPPHSNSRYPSTPYQNYHNRNDHQSNYQKPYRKFREKVQDSPKQTFDFDESASLVAKLFNPASGDHVALPLPPMLAPLKFTNYTARLVTPPTEEVIDFEKQWTFIKPICRKIINDTVRNQKLLFKSEREVYRNEVERKINSLKEEWKRDDETILKEEVARMSVLKKEFSANNEIEDMAKASCETIINQYKVKRDGEIDAIRSKLRVDENTLFQKYCSEVSNMTAVREELLPVLKDLMRGDYRSSSHFHHSPPYYGSISMEAIVYNLIRESKDNPVLSTLVAVISTLDSAEKKYAFVNKHLPCDESFFVHRACWDGNVEVVRYIVSLGAITNRFNRYNEHPVQVASSAFKGTTRSGVRYGPAQFNGILHILAETIHRQTKLDSSGAVEKDKPSETVTDARIYTSGNPLWLQNLPVKKQEGQKHVYIYNIPFEYPMASILDWFSACGKIECMYAPPASANHFDDIRNKIGEADNKHQGYCVIVFEDASCVPKALQYNAYPLLTRKLVITCHKLTTIERHNVYKKHLEEKALSENTTIEALGYRPLTKTLHEYIAIAEEKKKRNEEKREEKRLERKLEKQLEREKEKTSQLLSKGQDNIATSGEITEIDTVNPDTSVAPPTTNPLQPAWTTKLFTSPDQKHVHIFDIPFEMTKEQVSSLLLERSHDIVDMYMPYRKLNLEKEYDRKLQTQLSAVLGVPVDKCHRGTALILLKTSRNVSDFVLEFDNKEVTIANGTTVKLRFLRNRGDRKKPVTDIIKFEKTQLKQTNKNNNFITDLTLNSGIKRPHDVTLNIMKNAGEFVEQQKKRTKKHHTDIQPQVTLQAEKEDGEVENDFLIF